MNFIKILGASGSKSKTKAPTSFQISKNILIDTGNVINPLGDDALFINHIFITHSHADHIHDLPFIVESFFEKRDRPLIIYALQETITSLKNHLFNNQIWPDFSNINLFNSEKKALLYQTIEINEIIDIDGYLIKAIPANHIKGACGFVVSSNSNKILISGDTYTNESIWEEINSDENIKTLFIECTFPSDLKELAFNSKHLTPKLLQEELKKSRNPNLNIFVYHIKPTYYEKVIHEIECLNILNNKDNILKTGDMVDFNGSYITKTSNQENV